MCGTNREKNIHRNVFQKEACYRLQRRGVCNWWRCSRTSWPGFWNPLETKTRPRPKTLQFHSTEHLYHSIYQPINPSLHAAVKFQKKQQHFFIFFKLYPLWASSRQVCGCFCSGSAWHHTAALCLHLPTGCCVQPTSERHLTWRLQL